MTMLKRIILIASAFLCCFGAGAASVKNYTLVSPDGKLEVRTQVGKTVSWSLVVDGKEIVSPSPLSITLSDGTVWGEGSRFLRRYTKTVDNTVKTVVYKKAEVRDHYNELMLCFKGFNIEFRAYDEGAAYRFVAKSDKPLTVKAEKAEFRFAGDWEGFIPYVRVKGGFDEQFHSSFQFHNSFENIYTRERLSAWQKDRMCFLPLLVDAGGLKVCITESDLLNYPGMYLLGKKGSSTLDGVFAPYPTEWKIGGASNRELLRTAWDDCIAKVPGDMTFPWRVFGIARQDSDLLESDIVYNTARPSAEGADWSWVRPGLVSWDWWCDWNIFGVDFKAGINNETYEYFIDFAAENGLPYAILDLGWYVENLCDLFKVVPEIDLPRLVAYGRKKGVDLFLWAAVSAFDKDMDAICRHYSEMGIKGFKIDFMNADDQLMVNFYQRAAEAAAKYKLVLDFHGAFKPAGINRTYPNVLNIEGVYGLENVKWIKTTVMPEYDVTIPYIRMFAGPMDYTQGATINSTRAKYQPDREKPMSQGTRCHQIAEYVVFDAPLGMLCDSPSRYRKEQECTALIASIPTVWDDVVALGGEVGKSVAVARRSGADWYIGALTNWDERDMELKLDFLPAGLWKVTVFQDGVNAEKSPCDYAVKRFNASSGDTLKIHLASGGGWFAKFEK